MAIFHTNFSHVKRSTGCSSVQNAAYITGQVLNEDRRGLKADYSKNGERVYYSETLAPEWANDRFRDLNKVWNTFEAYEDSYAEKRYKTIETQEKHKNSAQTAMKGIIALPVELTPEQNKKLIQEYVQESFVKRGHVVTLAIHLDEGNPHAHLLISHRTVNEDNTISYAKDREMCSRFGLMCLRQSWSETANKHLEEAGLTVRIDHRSFKDQGIDLIPTIKEGWYARNLQNKGFEARTILENEKIRLENQEIIMNKSEVIMKELTSKNSTYSELDILKTVQNRTQDDIHLGQYIFESVLEKSIKLGHGYDMVTRFTSPEYKEKEDAVFSVTQKLCQTDSPIKIPKETIDKYIESYLKNSENKMSDEQKNAVYTLCSDKNFGLLIGRAGTGKTTGVLKPVVEIYQNAGYRIQGMALASVAAQNLQNEAGGKADSIDYYLYRWNEIDKIERKFEQENSDYSYEDRQKDLKKLEAYKEELPTKNTLIILDEVGMVDIDKCYQLTQMSEKVGCKFIAAGDNHQYKAIGGGDACRGLIDIAKDQGVYCELTKIFRQRVGWMQEASMQLSNLEVTSALIAYENNSHVKECENRIETFKAIAKEYVSRIDMNKIKADPTKTGLILTSINEDRLAINNEVRIQLKEKGILGEDLFVHQGKGFSVNDQIIFLSNDKQFRTKSYSGDFDVKNGTRGIIQSIKPVELRVLKDDKTVVIHTHEVKVLVSQSETIKFTSHEYGEFDHSYAVTGHKSQGQTVDWSIIHGNKNIDAYGLYVMLTRHRDDVSLYINKEDFATFRKFIDNINIRVKDLAMDYTILPEHKDFWYNVQEYKEIGREIMSAIKNKEDVSVLLNARKEMAMEICSDAENHKPYILQAGLTPERIEIVAGIRSKLLTTHEQEAKLVVENYVKVSQETRDVWKNIQQTHRGILTKTHPDYAQFSALREERGELAKIIISKEALCRPFVSKSHKELKHGISVIRKQAVHFEGIQMQKNLLKSPPNSEIKNQIETLNNYMELRDMSSQVWGEIRPRLEHLKDTLLSKGMDKELSSYNDLTVARDKIAHQITDKMDEYKALASTIKMTLNVDKLFDQTDDSIRQNCVTQFKESTTEMSKAMAACELYMRWKEESKEGAKKTLSIIMRNGLDFKELESYHQKYARIIVKSELKSEKDLNLFNSIETYDRYSKECNDLLKQCYSSIKGTDHKLYQSPLYENLKEVNVKRNEVLRDTLEKHSLNDFKQLADKMVVNTKFVDIDVLKRNQEQGYKQFLIDSFKSLKENDSERQYVAYEITQLLEKDIEKGEKRTSQLIYHSGLSERGIKHEALQYHRNEIFKTIGDDSTRELANLLISYEGYTKKSNFAYFQCRNESNERSIKPWESTYYRPFLETQKESDHLAKVIIDGYDHDCVKALSKDLKISEKIVDQDVLMQRSERSIKHSQLKRIDKIPGTDQPHKQRSIDKVAHEKYQSKTIYSQAMAQDVVKELNNNLEKIVRVLNDKPIIESNKNVIKIGRKGGSLHITISGERRGQFYDFSEQTGGNIIKLIDYFRGRGTADAWKWGREFLGGHYENKVVTIKGTQKTSIPVNEKTHDGKEILERVLPVPQGKEIKIQGSHDFQNHKDLHAVRWITQFGRKLQHIHEYKNQDGSLNFFVARVIEPNGTKTPFPIMLHKDSSGNHIWKGSGLAGMHDRPLYGLEQIGQNPKRDVLLVEGEKTADAARKLFPEYSVISWSGGSGAVEKSNWEPLKGMNVVVWPDHDQPGEKAANTIKESLSQINKELKEKPTFHIVSVPQTFPEKWDLADKIPSGYDQNKIKEIIENGFGRKVEPLEKNQVKSVVNLDKKITEVMSQQIDLKDGKVDPEAMKDVKKIFNLIKEVYDKSNVSMTEKDQLHHIKQSCFVSLQRKDEMSIHLFDKSAPEARDKGIVESLYKSALLKKTDEKYFEINYRSDNKERWDDYKNAVSKTSENIKIFKPELSPESTKVLAQTYVLLNSMVNDKVDVTKFIKHKIEIVSQNEALINNCAQKMITSNGTKTEKQFISVKESIVREMIITKDSPIRKTVSLVESAKHSINNDLNKEAQEQIQSRNQQHNQERNRENQLSL